MLKFLTFGGSELMALFHGEVGMLLSRGTLSKINSLPAKNNYDASG